MKRKKKSLVELAELSLFKISQSIELMEILNELSDGDRKFDAIISIVSSNLSYTCNNIEKAKSMISID